MTDPTQEQVEAVARALAPPIMWEFDGWRLDEPVDWGRVSSRDRLTLNALATAAIAALRPWMEAAEARGAESERARVVSYLRTQQAWHHDHDDGLSGFDGIAQGYGEAADGIEEGDHLPARHADQGEE